MRKAIVDCLLLEKALEEIDRKRAADPRPRAIVYRALKWYAWKLAGDLLRRGVVGLEVIGELAERARQRASPRRHIPRRRLVPDSAGLFRRLSAESTGHEEGLQDVGEATGPHGGDGGGD
jgi:hypothetical protein